MNSKILGLLACRVYRWRNAPHSLWHRWQAGGGCHLNTSGGRADPPLWYSHLDVDTPAKGPARAAQHHDAREVWRQGRHAAGVLKHAEHSVQFLYHFHAERIEGVRTIEREPEDGGTIAAALEPARQRAKLLGRQL